MVKHLAFPAVFPDKAPAAARKSGVAKRAKRAPAASTTAAKKPAAPRGKRSAKADSGGAVGLMCIPGVYAGLMSPPLDNGSRMGALPGTVRGENSRANPPPSPPKSSISLDENRQPNARAQPNAQRKEAAGAPARSPLPTALRHLEDAFIALEGTIRLFRARDVTSLLSTLRPQVERATGRAFPIGAFRQMIGIWPTAYTLEACCPVRRARPGDEPPLHHEAQLDWVVMPTGVTGKSAIRGGGTEAAVRSRRAEMRERLLAHVRAFHERWLAEGGRLPAPQPAALQPPAALQASLQAAEWPWQPRFPLEDCPPPREGEMPRLRGPASLLAADDQATRSAPPPPAAAVVPPPPVAPAVAPAAPAAPAAVPKGCEGLSAALIAKIQQRQEAAELDEQEAPERLRMQQLHAACPLALAVRGCIHTEKGSQRAQSVMSLAELLPRLQRCRERDGVVASRDELKEQIEALAVAAPKWLELMRTSNGVFARISNRLDFSMQLRELREQAAA